MLDGKYGAYVKWNDVNATIPKAIEKDKITLEQAIDLIRARQAATPVKKGAKKAPAKAAASAKAAPKKAAAKKTAPKKK